jgi:YVTN family beta-propeller protein
METVWADAATSTFLYMGSSDTSVSVVDTTNYSIIATMPVGQYPSSIAVDPTTHRAYVTSSKTNTLSVIGPQRA